MTTNQKSKSIDSCFGHTFVTRATLSEFDWLRKGMNMPIGFIDVCTLNEIFGGY